MQNNFRRKSEHEFFMLGLVADFFHCQIHRSRRAEQTDGHECRLRDTAFPAAGNALVIDGQNYTNQRYECEPAHSRQNNAKELRI